MTDQKQKNSSREAFTQFLIERGLRKTPERFAIADKVLGMKDHFYVESLRESMERDGYRVSRATLYNTIQLLIEAGFVRRHQFDGQPAQYERVSPKEVTNHHHLVCRKCGKVKEVTDAELIKALSLKRYRTFQPEFFTLYVYGTCSTCQRKLKKSNG